MTQRSRYGLIKKIHVARQQHGWSDNDDTYRGFLRTATGKDSLRAMNFRELEQVIRAFWRAGWSENKKRKNDTHGLPQNVTGTDKKGTRALMGKIEALLAEMGTSSNGFVPWSYAAAILKRMYKVDRLEWATPEQLRGVITALLRGGKRKGGQVAMDMSTGQQYIRTWRGPKRGFVWEPVEQEAADV